MTASMPECDVELVILHPYINGENRYSIQYSLNV